MAKIRSLALFDIPKINKLISFMDIEVKSFFDGIVLPYPVTLLYKILPMRMKFLPESFVLFDKKDLLAYISVKKHNHYYKKWKLSRLLMANNQYNAGLTLIQYTISKLAAKGATSFHAEIEETQGELINLFTDGAGFRQCSKHQVWKLADNNLEAKEQLLGLKLRPYKNSDATTVTDLFNESILTHFRPTLSQDKREYYDRLFAGLSANSEYKYLVEDANTKKVICYFSIKTADNKLYLLDTQISKGYEHIFEQILCYGLKLIKKRTKNFTYCFLNRQYLQTSNHFESVLKEKGFAPQTSSVILVKDLFRTVKCEEKEKQAVLYTDINSTPAF